MRTLRKSVPIQFPTSWVVGALISSWRAVNEYLEVTGQDEKMKKFKTLWGENPEWYSKLPL